MTDELLHSIANGVATITFNRPATRNAMTPAFLEHFIELFKALETDTTVRVLLLTGVGPDFSSGGDKAFLQTLKTMTSAQVRDVVYRAFLGAVRTVKLCTKPTVAAVNGGAVGGGCEVAVACDFRLVTPRLLFPRELDCDRLDPTAWRHVPIATPDRPRTSFKHDHAGSTRLW